MTEIQNNICDIHVGGNDSQNVRLLLNKIMGWKMEDIIMEDESTGLINSIWVCRTGTTDPRPSPVVVRACRQRSVWRSVMVNSMCYQRVVMERLHHLGLGPPVYGVFSNGIVYGYVKGRCLSFKEVQEDERLESAALENLHGLHQVAMPVDEAAVNRPLLDACVFYRVTQLLHNLPDSHVDPDVLQCLQQKVRQ